MERVPLNKAAIYCTSELPVTPLWVPLLSDFWTGCGPWGLGNDEKPLPLLTKIFLPTVFRLVGYHPVGINPLDVLFPGVCTSNTARQLLSALAIYNVFSSGDNARPLVVEP